jgi:ribonuclease Z
MEPFKVYVLGCGSAKPTTRHFASSQVVEVRGRVFMVDCGEGTQIQLRRAKVRFTRLRAVFITHLHGDHCFGLIGLICSFALSGRMVPLHVYAPQALKKLLDDMLAMFAPDLSFEVIFHPVDTTASQVIYEDSAVTVTTLPLKHRIPCCGYLFKEKPTLPHIRRDMVDFYHIPVTKMMDIKNGADWTDEDGNVVANERLVTPPDPIRSFAYCSDTRYMPALHQFIEGVSLLYHESTYDERHKDLAEAYCHSTAAEAATVALQAKAHQLLIGHYSSRYEDESVLLQEAQSIFPQTTLAQEGMVVDVL